MMVEVYRTVDERRAELRETVAELDALAAKEDAAFRAYKAAEQAWRAARDAASTVRERRNAQLRGLAGDVAAGRVERRELATDAGIVPRHLLRLLGDDKPEPGPDGDAL